MVKLALIIIGRYCLNQNNKKNMSDGDYIKAVNQLVEYERRVGCKL
jgi:hypothetical protein